jgi:ribosomal protein L20
MWARPCARLCLGVHFDVSRFPECRAAIRMCTLARADAYGYVHDAEEQRRLRACWVSGKNEAVAPNARRYRQSYALIVQAMDEAST